jgi:hypothetical protein
MTTLGYARSAARSTGRHALLAAPARLYPVRPSESSTWVVVTRWLSELSGARDPSGYLRFRAIRSVVCIVNTKCTRSHLAHLRREHHRYRRRGEHRGDPHTALFEMRNHRILQLSNDGGGIAATTVQDKGNLRHGAMQRLDPAGAIPQSVIERACKPDR